MDHSFTKGDTILSITLPSSGIDVIKHDKHSIMCIPDDIYSRCRDNMVVVLHGDPSANQYIIPYTSNHFIELTNVTYVGDTDTCYLQDGLFKIWYASSINSNYTIIQSNNTTTNWYSNDKMLIPTRSFVGCAIIKKHFIAVHKHGTNHNCLQLDCDQRLVGYNKLQQKFNTLYDDRHQLQNEFNDIKFKYDTLLNESDHSRVQLTTKITELQNTIDQQSDAINNYTTDNNQLQNDLVQLHQQQSDLQLQYDQQTIQFNISNNRYDYLDKQHSSLQRAAVQLQSDYDMVSVQNNVLNNKITQLQESNQLHSQQLNDVHDKQYSVLQDRNIELQGIIDQQHNQYNQLQHKYDMLQVDVTKQIDGTNMYKSLNDELQRVITQLHDGHRNVQTQLNTHTVGYEQLQHKYEMVTTANIQLQQKLTELQQLNETLVIDHNQRYHIVCDRNMALQDIIDRHTYKTKNNTINNQNMALQETISTLPDTTEAYVVSAQQLCDPQSHQPNNEFGEIQNTINPQAESINNTTSTRSTSKCYIVLLSVFMLIVSVLYMVMLDK